ncbi:MAG: hypothetical protein RR279_01025 [Alistipes sp.]
MSTNGKKIAINTIIMYGRLIITSIIGLLATRLLLKAVGIDDYGIFAIVGGIVAIAGIVNAIMLGTTNRFITYALGENDPKRLNEIFNITLVIHICIAIIVLLIASPIGEWYINKHLVLPEGSLYKTLWVFRFSLLGAVISFIGVPFQGLMMADEKFFAFCFRDVLASISKFLIILFIAQFDGSRLILYAGLLMGITFLQQIWNYTYCKLHYKEKISFHIVQGGHKYREVLTFSIWTGYGAMAYIFRVQGSNLLINAFFGVTLNAALGIASSVDNIVAMFTQSLSRTISPQIIKNYANGCIDASIELVGKSSRYSFMMMMILIVPIWTSLEYLLQIWLDVVPQYTVIMIKLMFIDALINTINSGVTEFVFATGKIKRYQLSINTIYLFSIPLAYLCVKIVHEPQVIFYAYILVSILLFFVRQIELQRRSKISIKKFASQVYIPVLRILILIIPLFMFLPQSLHPIVRMLLTTGYTVCILYSVGVTKIEKQFIINYIRSKCLK